MPHSLCPLVLGTAWRTATCLLPASRCELLIQSVFQPLGFQSLGGILSVRHTAHSPFQAALMGAALIGLQKVIIETAPNGVRLVLQLWFLRKNGIQNQNEEPLSTSDISSHGAEEQPQPLVMPTVQALICLPLWVSQGTEHLRSTAILSPRTKSKYYVHWLHSQWKHFWLIIVPHLSPAHGTMVAGIVSEPSAP